MERGTDWTRQGLNESKGRQSLVVGHWSFVFDFSSSQEANWQESTAKSKQQTSDFRSPYKLERASMEQRVRFRPLSSQGAHL